MWVGDNPSKEQMRVHGAQVRKKWLKAAEKAGVARSGHGDDDVSVIQSIRALNVSEEEKLQYETVEFLTLAYRSFLKETASADEIRYSSLLTPSQAEKVAVGKETAALRQARQVSVNLAADRIAKLDAPRKRTDDATEKSEPGTPRRATSKSQFLVCLV